MDENQITKKELKSIAFNISESTDFRKSSGEKMKGREELFKLIGAIFFMIYVHMFGSCISCSWFVSYFLKKCLNSSKNNECKYLTEGTSCLGSAPY